jgi:hypothetical protein
MVLIVKLTPVLWGPIWGVGVGERADSGGDCGGASLRISSVRPGHPPDRADAYLQAHHRVCKQNNAVQVTHLHEECDVKMLQLIRTIPPSCSQRIAEINQTIWTQLEDNQWLYVAPRRDVLTIPCSKQEPSDIEVVGTGKLILHSACKAYGARVLIQAKTIMTTTLRKMLFLHCLLTMIVVHLRKRMLT